jgi:predicted dehydrogenase
MSKGDLSRRNFVAGGGKLAMGAMIVPRHVLGGVGYQAPSDTLNVAIVGAGGMGAENAQELGSENIVAVCDVDHGLVARKADERSRDGDGNPREKGVRWLEQYTSARKYEDFREMLENESDLDAVVIATPDHAHAPIAKACMEAGKHVYVQKPLTWSVGEARMLQELALETGVVTQMGNQGHSLDDGRDVVEWIRAGVIGPVREVHIWTNRPIWPQGLPAPIMPEEMPADDNWWPGSTNRRIASAIAKDYKKPDTLNWELFRCANAVDTPYHPIYHPFHWRGWTAFGVGALGDMGAHLIDHPYWALELGYPTSIEATSTPWGGPGHDPVSYPVAMTVHYRFPRRGMRPPVNMHWYDGGLMPPRPDDLPSDVPLKREGGVIMVGERGILMHETYGRNPQLFPVGLMDEAGTVAQWLPRIEDSHEMNWVKACKGEGEASSPFSYAAPLTEVMVLGMVAVRTGQGRKIYYDGPNMRITNDEAANQFLTRDYRPGFGV